MTDDYDERTSIMSYRVAYSSLAGLTIAAGTPALIAYLGGDRAAYGTTSIVLGVVIAISMLMTVLFTRGARELSQVNREKYGVREYLTSMGRNRPFFTLAVLKFLVFLAAGINGSAGMFFMTHFLQRQEMGMAFLTFAANVAGLLAIPLWKKLSIGRDKRWLWMGAMLSTAVLNASWAFSSPTEGDLLFGLRAVLTGAVGTAGTLMGFAMLPDTIEYDRLTTGHDRAGLYTGLLGFLEKNAFAFGPLVIGFVFSAAGVTKAGEQSATAIAAIVAAKSWIPALILLLSAALLFLYRLDAKRLAELRAQAMVSANGGAAGPSG